MTLDEGDACPRPGCEGEVVWMHHGMIPADDTLYVLPARLVCVACGEAVTS